MIWIAFLTGMFFGGCVSVIVFGCRVAGENTDVHEHYRLLLKSGRDIYTARLADAQRSFDVELEEQADRMERPWLHN